MKSPMLWLVGLAALLAWYLGRQPSNPLLGQGGILQTPLSPASLGQVGPSLNPDAVNFTPPMSTAAYSTWMTNPSGPQYAGWLTDGYRTR